MRSRVSPLSEDIPRNRARVSCHRAVRLGVIQAFENLKPTGEPLTESPLRDTTIRWPQDYFSFHSLDEVVVESLSAKPIELKNASVGDVQVSGAPSPPTTGARS